MRRALPFLLTLAILAAVPARATAEVFLGASLRNALHPSQCLDADLNTWLTNPGRVQQWHCLGTDNQTWSGGSFDFFGAPIRPPDPPYGPPNKCLDAWPDDTQHGGYRVSLWDCNAQTQQDWQIEGMGPNTWVIRNARFDKCLDVHTDWAWDGAPVGLWDCWKGANQQWMTPTYSLGGGGGGGGSPSSPGAPTNPCNPSPAAAGMRVRVAVGRRHRAVTVSYGRHPRVRGRLVTAGGGAVAGASVCVGTSRLGRNAPVQPRTSVVTDSRGRFSYRLPGGFSRRVWFVHRTGGSSAAANLLVRVRAPIRLRRPRHGFHNGQRMTLSGRVGGNWNPRGLLVQIQVRRGRGWQTVGSARVRSRGRFGWSYRFSRTTGVQVYRFRALMPSQLGSPFATGASRSVPVRVRG